MRCALIGHTGFVGSVLLRAGHYTQTYNSRNIGDIRGQAFDRVVCAGVSAVKWWANKHPAEDAAGIGALVDCLSEVTAEQFTLISTIDVYASPDGVTENDIPEEAGLHAYGLNRLRLERWVAGRFPRSTILRLPGLFGPGLKKNAIYDLIHDNNVGTIQPNARFQWYPVTRLAVDIDRVEASGRRLLNMATEPVSMEEIRQRFFPGQTIGAPGTHPPCYDMRSRHAEEFGGSGGYIIRARDVMDELETFLNTERRG